MGYPGTKRSEIWTINTDRVYTALPAADPDTLAFLTAGGEMTAGPTSPLAWYSRVNVDTLTSSPVTWGALSQPGDTVNASYHSARPLMVTSSGTVLQGTTDWPHASPYPGVVLRSVNYGQSWTEVANVSALRNFNGIYETSTTGTLLAGAYNAVYRSVDDGLNWSQLSAINSGTITGDTIPTCFLEVPNGDIYCGCNSSLLLSDEQVVIMKSTDGGSTWAEDFVSVFDWDHSWQYFGVNHLYYHTATDTIWALVSAFDAPHSNMALWYKTGAGAWTAYSFQSSMKVSNFTLPYGSVFDVIFNAAGVPTHIAGVFDVYWLGFSIPSAVSLGLVLVLDTSTSTYDIHLCSNNLLVPDLIDWPYQFEDLSSEDLTTPDLYICGSQNLLTLDNTPVDLGVTVGAPFAPGDVVYFINRVMPWTTWDTSGVMEVNSVGFVRIPDSEL